MKTQGNIFSDTFDTISDAIGNFAEKIWDVATVTLGVILRDAINWAIGAIGDLARASLDAAEDLQGIQFRLQGFNFQTAIDSGLEYNAAMEEAIRLTEEQMSWVMRLAAQSPFDATDIGFVFSMATAYGFTSDESKRLTQSTMDFVAAMGLTSVEQKRVIINLGQMVQRGKITSREMNDLARGSLLPLADVLDRVAEKMGITTAALTKLIQKPGEGVDYQLFMDAFNEMIAQEERFIDAGKRMAYLFKAAVENVYQTTRDLIGYYILIPGILGPVGTKIASIMETVTEEENWNKIIAVATNVGRALENIVTTLLDAWIPGNQTIVDGILGALNAVSGWLNTHKEDIVDFFLGKEVVEGWRPFGEEMRTGGVVGFFEDVYKIITDIYNWAIEKGPAIWGVFTNIYTEITTFLESEKFLGWLDTLKKWVDTNGPLISDFFKTLGEIITGVIGGVLGIKPAKGELAGEDMIAPGLSSALEAIKKLMQYIVDNKDGLTTVLTALAKAFIAVEAAKFAWNNALAFLMGLKGATFTIAISETILAPVALTAIREWINTNIKIPLEDALRNIDIGGMVSSIGTTGVGWLESLKKSVLTAISDIKMYFFGTSGTKGKGQEGLWNELMSAADNMNWYDLGVRIVSGILNGVKSMAASLIGYLISMAQQAWSGILGVFGGGGGWGGGGGGSVPSGGGDPIPTGNTGNFGNKSKTLPGAVTPKAKTATGAVVSPATVASTSNYNLTINTKAKTEPILQDYAVLKSLRT